MKPRVAINGSGRIGRAFFRANLMANLVEIVAVNDPSPNKTLAHLLRHDSIYGTIEADIKIAGETGILVNGKKIETFSDRNPEKLPWGALNIDIVIESTGVFRDREGAEKHIKAGAKKVIVSAPGKNMDRTIVLGVNQNTLNKTTDKIVSNASCTTNCLAPIVKVINDKFKIVKGMMTTVHAYTNDQNILDTSHKDMRRARATGLNIIPTETGAAKAIGEVIPELKGKLNGTALRVPVPTGSLVDLVCEVAQPTTVEQVNAAFKEASETYLKGILAYCDEPLVSSDFIKDNNSSIVDGLSTMVVEGNLIKVFAWYDNEWGYSVRLVELAAFMG